MKKYLLFTIGLFAAIGVRAQSAAQVEHAVSSQPPEVQTRSYEKDGKLVTERTTTTRVTETDTLTPARVFKAAIFISNRDCPALDGKMRYLEDLVTAKVTDEGFKVLSREAVVDAMRAFDPAVASRPRPDDSVETLLTNQTSILRLSQNLGADYLLVASIGSLGTDVRNINAYGVRESVKQTTLRLTYKVLDGQTGESITADEVKVSAESRQTPNLSESNGDTVNTLLDEAASKLAGSLRARIAQNRITPPQSGAAWVSITIRPEAADLYIPDVRIGENHTIVMGEGKFKVSPLSVTVEIDGVAVGSAPGTIRVHPGFAHLRLTRDGFKPWERTINAVEGQTLVAAMQLSPEGYARWQHSTAFINGLKNGAKLTDAQARALDGLGKMLEQSGLKVDTKGPLIKKSLF